jgi:hypothetical protein
MKYQHFTLVEQELLILLDPLSSPLIFSGVRVTQSLVFCVMLVDCCLSFCLFSNWNFIFYKDWLQNYFSSWKWKIPKSKEWFQEGNCPPNLKISILSINIMNTYFEVWGTISFLESLFWFRNFPFSWWEIIL